MLRRLWRKNQADLEGNCDLGPFGVTYCHKALDKVRNIG